MTSNPPNVKVPRISEDERARREKAIRAARASTALEGFILPKACDEADARFIAGEITNEQHDMEYDRIAAITV